MSENQEETAGEAVQEKKVICVICPNSCEIVVKQMPDGSLLMEGQGCKRGEFLAPKRTLATTVRIREALIPLLPVRTNVPVPKEKLNEILDILARIEVTAPITCGDVIVENVLDLEANVIATRTLGVDTCTKIACELPE
jgi:CxxC motif-containing protein